VNGITAPTIRVPAINHDGVELEDYHEYALLILYEDLTGATRFTTARWQIRRWYDVQFPSHLELAEFLTRAFGTEDLTTINETQDSQGSSV